MMVFSMGEYRLDGRSAFELLVSLFIGGGFHHYGGLSCVAMSLVSFVVKRTLTVFPIRLRRLLLTLSSGPGLPRVVGPVH